ncbi:MAG: T9SS type A sorting domain-containing protein [Bacteroidota bacterium]
MYKNLYLPIPLILCLILLIGSIPQTFSQTTLSLQAEQDNTLYENEEGNISNGSGDFLFVGRNNQPAESIRRSLIQFSLTELSEGSLIDSVSLVFNVNRTNDNFTAPVSLHLVITPWGEGSSDAPASESLGDTARADDATWLFAKFDSVAWNSPGGDFAVEASATDTLIMSSEKIIFSSQAMVDEMNAAVANNQESISWMLIGDESRNQSVRKLNSRENPEEEFRPFLFVQFATSTSIKAKSLSEKVRIFPNPVSDDVVYITGQGVDRKKVMLRLKNLIGKTILETETNSFSGELNTSLPIGNLPSGIYFVSIITESDKFTRKLIIK